MGCRNSGTSQAIGALLFHSMCGFVNTQLLKLGLRVKPILLMFLLVGAGRREAAEDLHGPYTSGHDKSHVVTEHDATFFK